jgi:hypothetical protein
MQHTARSLVIDSPGCKPIGTEEKIDSLLAMTQVAPCVCYTYYK